MRSLFFLLFARRRPSRCAPSSLALCLGSVAALLVLWTGGHLLAAVSCPSSYSSSWSCSSSKSSSSKSSSSVSLLGVDGTSQTRRDQEAEGAAMGSREIVQAIQWLLLQRDRSGTAADNEEVEEEKKEEEEAAIEEEEEIEEEATAIEEHDEKGGVCDPPQPRYEEIAFARPADLDVSIFPLDPTTHKAFAYERQAQEVFARSRERMCGHCRQYIVGVPNIGSRLGHFVSNWRSGKSLSMAYNLTFIHHPITPNQPEHDYLEPFLGLGLDEHYRYHDICMEGKYGKPCVKFLDCLTVIPVEYVMQPEYLPSLVAQHSGECDVVYHLPLNELLHDQALTVRSMQRSYQKARALYPIASYFDQRHIHVAMHIRRGDVVTNPNETDRLTDESVYVKLAKSLEQLVLQANCTPFQLPVYFHIYSQGTEEDFAALAQSSVHVVFHLNEDIYTTLHHLVLSDVFVAARSGFSDIAAKLRAPWQVTLYPSGYWDQKLPHWSVFDNGSGALKDAPFVRRAIDGMIRARSSSSPSL